MRASLKNQLQALKTLIDYGADLNVVDNVGKTALHWAGTYHLFIHTDLSLVFYGNVDIVKELVGAGCNCTIVDNTKNTALAIANKRGQPDTINFLQEHTPTE